MHIRRVQHLFFYVRDGAMLDIGAFLSGSLRTFYEGELEALSLLTGSAHKIDRAVLELLLRVPSERWIPFEELELDGLVPAAASDTVSDLALKGLLTTDSSDGNMARLRQMDQDMRSTQWNAYGALAHFMTKWQDVRAGLRLPTLGEENSSDVQRLRLAQKRRDATPEELGGLVDKDNQLLPFISQFGRPPSHFHVPQHIGTSIELPVIHKNGALYDTLIKRRTVRAFDPEATLNVDNLSVILRYVFGCQGLWEAGDDVWGIKRTSPSGGGLHPIEVYPLIMNVDGIKPGLYHYGAEHHALEPLSALSSTEAIEMADEITAGQIYPRWAQALFVMTARFYRSYWKYRNHRRAYSVILMDAGHLSQTFYLVCTELGVGPFVTAAINSTNIEARLGLDGVTEGAIALCGCGTPKSKSFGLEPKYQAFVPRG